MKENERSRKEQRKDRARSLRYSGFREAGRGECGPTDSVEASGDLRTRTKKVVGGSATLDSLCGQNKSRLFKKICEEWSGEVVADGCCSLRERWGISPTDRVMLRQMAAAAGRKESDSLSLFQR